MEDFLIEIFSKYDLNYNPAEAVMTINKKILVKDFIKIKKIIRDYELNIKELIVLGKK